MHIVSQLGHQGRRKHQKFGGGRAPASRGTLLFRVLKRAPKKFFPQMLATGGGREKFSRRTIPKLHVFDHIFLKNLEISKKI
jgi:hypothetical protein